MPPCNLDNIIIVLRTETLDDKNKISMGEGLGKSNNLLNEITNQDTPGGLKEYLEETKIKYDIVENTNEDEINNTRRTKGENTEGLKKRDRKKEINKSKFNYSQEATNDGSRDSRNATSNWVECRPVPYLRHASECCMSKITTNMPKKI